MHKLTCFLPCRILSIYWLFKPLHNSEILFSQFFALTIPLATRIPFEPNSIAFETSLAETIPAPHKSFVEFFANLTASTAFVINAGFSVEIAHVEESLPL